MRAIRVGAYMAAAAMIGALPTIEFAGGRSRRFVGHKPAQSKYRPHQGNREMARRRRQIERGQIKAENGLVRSAA